MAGRKLQLYWFLIGTALLPLFGCQQPSVEKAEVDDLRIRVRALEQGQEDIVKEIRSAEAKAKAAAVAAAPPPVAVVPPISYKLLPSNNVYPNKARCEAGKAVIQQERDRTEAEMNERGYRTVAQPSLTCLPL